MGFVFFVSRVEGTSVHLSCILKHAKIVSKKGAVRYGTISGLSVSVEECTSTVIYCVCVDRSMYVSVVLIEMAFIHWLAVELVFFTTNRLYSGIQHWILCEA